MTLENLDRREEMRNDMLPSPRSRAVAPFRHVVPPPGHPKIKSLPGCSASEWYEQKKTVPELASFLKRFPIEAIDKNYRGFTSDGDVREGLLKYASDEGAPVEAMIAATERLLSVLSPEQKTATVFKSVEADELRIWSNPELYVNPGGLRLDECTEGVQTAVHGILQASLSSVGYAKVLGCCLTNDFLGDLVNGKGVLNKHSYNFRLFGSPSLHQPWAYTFFGHHLCLVVFIQGNRMVIGPTFFGAEPDHIDEGPYKGLRLFGEEEFLSLKLMQSLAPDLQTKATLSKDLESEDRWSPFDERHLGGAMQDNRVVPHEGCLVTKFTPAQQEDVVTLFKAFNECYPDNVLEHRVRVFKAHLGETFFAWIGKFGDTDPYYYRIHSPVTFLEFDFHCGVFLTNTTPAKFHIHTINRIPNRGDYGKALLQQYRQETVNGVP